jgi:hypothetical protein
MTTFDLGIICSSVWCAASVIGERNSGGCLVIGAAWFFFGVAWKVLQ